VLTAPSAADALELLRRRSVDLVLVDYFMPGMTGEDFVRGLRTFNPLIQVILQTGYASEQPPRELLRRLDIQGYATPDLHQLQPLDDLLQGVLLQTAGLIGAIDTFLAIAAKPSDCAGVADGFVALVSGTVGSAVLPLRCIDGQRHDEFFVETKTKLLRGADEELYRRKRAARAPRNATSGAPAATTTVS
jgi:CheY-like chemotaxis protein